MNIELTLKGSDKKWAEDAQVKLLGHVREEILPGIAARVALRALLFLPPMHEKSRSSFPVTKADPLLFLRSAIEIVNSSTSKSGLESLDGATPDPDAVSAPLASLYYCYRSAFETEKRREFISLGAISCLYAYNSFPTSPGGRSQFEVDCLEASKALASRERLFSRPLFGQSILESLEGFEGNLNPLYQMGADYEFWARWYQGFIEGQPLDTELQQLITGMEHEVWRSGSRVISERIRATETRLELTNRIRILEQERDQISADLARRSIGGNKPPAEMRLENEAALSARPGSV